MGHYGVPVQYERSFRWKVAHFRNLCAVSRQLPSACVCVCVCVCVCACNCCIVEALFMNVHVCAASESKVILHSSSLLQ